MLTLGYTSFIVCHLVLCYPFPWANRGILLFFPDYFEPHTAHSSDWNIPISTTVRKEYRKACLKGAHFQGVINDCSVEAHNTQISTSPNSQLYSELIIRISSCYLQPLASHVISQGLQLGQWPHCSTEVYWEPTLQNIKGCFSSSR